MKELIDFQPNIHQLYQDLLAHQYLKQDFAALGDQFQWGETSLSATNLEDKIKGACLGGAVGDALGRALENISPDPKTFWIDKYQPEKDYIRGPVGTVTDETQMTMWLMESLCRHGGLHPAHLAVEFSERYIRHVHNSTREFMRNMTRGSFEWYEAGVVSSDNSAAARGVAIGLYYRNDPQALKKAAIISAYITHHDDLAIASSIVVAYTTARLIQMRPLDLVRLEDRFKFLHDIARTVEGIAEDAKTKYAEEPTSLSKRIGDLIPNFLSHDYPLEWVQKEIQSSEYVLESLPFALYAFLANPTDYTAGLVQAVNHSEDSGAVGFLVGSFLGCLNGYSSIEHYYLENLEFKDELVLLSEQVIRNPYGA
jgi:ADP-ribosyl-[dinitrogen reductase] hydrolase